MELAFQAGTAIAIVFPILLLLGIPISITIGISSIFGILTTLSWDVAVLTGAQRIFTGISSFSLLAIPFFVLAGTIMNSGGTMAPLQKAEGYDKNYSAAVNIASAPTGLLIPPSNSLIIYSLVSGGTSVAALFMAGYIPGILWGLSVMVVAFILAKKYKYSSKYTITFKEAIKIFIDALPSLALIFIIIGGIVGGVFTATEGAAVAVVYSFILSFFFYKSIKLKDIPRILLETVEMTGIIIFLIGVSSIMSWVMAFTNIPNAITELLLGISSNPIVILLIMNLVLLIVGTFMDLTPAILIFTPIFLPIAKNFGMDSVQFGIMLIFNLCIGNITPPVGNTLFIGCKVGKTSIEEVIKYLLPFYGGILVVLMLVTFIPEISLFIPKLMGMI